MKLTKLMLSASVAVMALVSCNKEEGPSVRGDYKSVEIEINNLFMTKSAGEAIADGTSVTLNNFRIYLTDGTNFYWDATDEAGTVLDKSAYQFTAKPSEALTFHFVNPSVNRVVAVANLTDEQYASINTYADIKAMKLQVAAQQEADALALYAEDVLEATGEQHVPAGDTHKEGEVLITNVYKADLVFTPRVARIELDGFAVGFQAGEKARYNKISIHQVAFNNYYPTTALYNGQEEGPIADCKAENPASAVAYLTGNAGTEWYSDKATLEFSRPAGMTSDTWVEKELDNTFYYHFFPIPAASAETEGYPELMFQLSTEDTEGASSSTYIYTKQFKGSNGAAITSFEEGKIYRMNFSTSVESDKGDGDVPVKEEDIDQLGRCLDITVTVDDWNVILVTPEF